MKKIFTFLLICFITLGIIPVKADMGPPIIAEYEIIITNKDGAACYEYNTQGKIVKGTKTVEYGKTFTVYFEIENGYINTSDDECLLVKTADAKPKKEKFDLNSERVTELKSVKAVILAKGGLNLRKGPATAYNKITTIPQYTTVTLTHQAGTFWFYTEYKGNKGWISGINSYLGYNDDNILISMEDTPIKDNNGKTIATIPALTEITNYIKLVDYDNPAYYVNYNGKTGYVSTMNLKVEGKIKLLQDIDLHQGKKILKKLSKGNTYDISIVNYDYDEEKYYIPSENGYIVFNLSNNDEKNANKIEIVKEPTSIKKTTGFIGEGLFGEEKTEKIDKAPYTTVETETEINEESNEPIATNQPTKNPSKEIIIICVLGAIILVLTAIITILLINKKPKQVIVKEEVKPEINKEHEVNEDKEKSDN